MRALVCLMGVVNRSIRSTWPVFRENLVRILEQHCDHVHLYVYNLDTGDAPVDGVTLEGNVRDKIPADVIEEQRQADVDVIVDNKCTPCEFRSDYTETAKRNAMRQLHTEFMVGTYVERVADQFDVVVVCTADARLARPLNMKHVREAVATATVFTSEVNNADGYTNGFYVGPPRALLPVLKRYLDFESSNYDYEYTVKKAFDMHGIKHGATDMVFWKIRANGNVFWPFKRTSFLEDAEAARVHELYESDVKSIEAMTPLQLVEHEVCSAPAGAQMLPLLLVLLAALAGLAGLALWQIRSGHA
jgi:hypothetical protein